VRDVAVSVSLSEKARRPTRPAGLRQFRLRRAVEDHESSDELTLIVN